MNRKEFERVIRERNAKYESLANEILEGLTSKEAKVLSAIGDRQIVIVCGASGDGKSLSISKANESLPRDEQIAECPVILTCTDAENAIETVRTDDSAYVNCAHVVYSLLSVETGRAIVAKNPPYIKVVFCIKP